MSQPFRLTAKQEQALGLIGGPSKHIMLEGGSRSGKTFLAVRTVIFRALAAPASRHAMLRFRFNHIKASIIHDTFPKVLNACFPEVKCHMDKSDWFAEFPNRSQIWFGGLDDKDRTEKILGQEHATLYLNEASQIPYQSVLMAQTRLAQVARYKLDGKEGTLRLKMLYDCNPPPQSHWTYRLFHKLIDPETGKPLKHPEEYAHILLNPGDNADNLPADYLRMLEGLPARMRTRFLEGKYADVTEGALWSVETIDKWRTESDLPDMQRIIVAVDPSGAGDTDNADNDAIGIVVAGLGTDGNGYVLEDLTVKAGPKVWGNIAVSAYDRHDADLIVGETNYGGEMVKFVIEAARRSVPFKKITSSRGKVLRAEPISSLTEQGKIRFAGTFPELEDELCSFTTKGFMGNNSPNRADAFVFAMSELFPGITKIEQTPTPKRKERPRYQGAGSWMG